MGTKQPQYVNTSLNQYETRVGQRLRRFDQDNMSRRLWDQDPSLWKSDPVVQQKIKNRLGWLNVPETMISRTKELMEFSASVRAAGFRHAVLLGMGGSSLCPEVLRHVYGPAEGYPALTVLDSTDPETIICVEEKIDFQNTLFIVASKSGTTLEVQALYRYFYERLAALRPDRPGQQFIAITDPGTPLENLAKERGFRRIFTNPSDIGGRYSALSYFGLVPAALMGLDLEAFLDRARKKIRQCAADLPAAENVGIRLGAVLGELGKAGRDKLTLLSSPSMASYGLWLEQLIAESTGKEGKGLVPVVGEPVGNPSVYGSDRLFLHIRLQSSPDPEIDAAARAIQKSGQPFIEICLQDPLDLAGEFFVWEMATAVAGAVLEINPFDEPNVSESKENTQQALQKLHATGRLREDDSILDFEGIRVWGSKRTDLHSPVDLMKEMFGSARAGAYVSLMAYLEQDEKHDHLLQKIRLTIRDRLHVATTLGYGPRFLHSTGQLHKGGPRNGLFLQFTAEDQDDIAVPGESYTFGILKAAQALGDYQSLERKGLRVMGVYLGRDIEKGLGRIAEWLELAFKT